MSFVASQLFQAHVCILLCAALTRFPQLFLPIGFLPSLNVTA